MEPREPIDPQQLMTLAKHGDAQAFDRLHGQFFVPVFRYVLKRVKHRETAEDIAQGVFIKIYTSLERFENTGKHPLAYFFTIARNAIIDHWRRQNVTTEIIDIEKLERMDSGLETDEAIKHIEKKEHISRGLTHLGGDQKQVIEMKFLQGFSTKEIAGRLNKTEVNIRQIQRRALLKLSVHMKA